MSPQVVVTFSSFEKMEQICSILLEKLDKSVHVGAPQFYHSPECLSQARYLTLLDLIWTDDSVYRVGICVLPCFAGSVRVHQLFETLKWRPIKSVMSWCKDWGFPYWSERRRPKSGGMRRTTAARSRVHLVAFPTYRQSLSHPACPSPTVSEMDHFRFLLIKITHLYKELNVTTLNKDIHFEISKCMRCHV